VVGNVNIRSIDLQVLIPRATEASKVQQLNDHQTTLQQQQNAADWQRLSAARQQQVQRTPQSAGGKVNPDANREGQQGDERKKEAEQPAQAAEADNSQECGPDPLRGHHIDIKT
jgi:hypothetical protein